MVARFVASGSIFVAAGMLPLVLYGAYIKLSVYLILCPWAWWWVSGIGIGLCVISWPFSPNANSLHRFYRDRISKAFMFRQVDGTGPLPPRWTPLDLVRRPRNAPLSSQTSDERESKVWSKPSVRSASAAHDNHVTIVARDPIPLGDLASRHTPFHIINAKLNLQGSIHANKRGRDCDFFVFTPTHFGSGLVGYYRTSATFGELNDAAEEDGKGVDLATALAISGAAASSAMGGMKAYKALAPTLALLNIRLGYWLTNPRTQTDGGWAAVKRNLKKQFYLATESLGLLDEKSDRVYLTDGCHIENLGVYELLRRRCQAIVVIDAEADRDISCSSMVAVSRYARIDLGVRIEIDPASIAASHRAVDRGVDQGAPILPANGLHAALGRIIYPNGQIGFLLYVKASLSGDEPDYVLRYKRAYPDFPHESTGDQFFSEEQFECYRALAGC